MDDLSAMTRDQLVAEVRRLQVLASAAPGAPDPFDLARFALLDQVHDAVIVTDKDWRIRFWNAAAERFYGWRRGEALGCLVGSVVPVVQYLADDYSQSSAQAALMTAGIWRGEAVQRHREGHDLVVDASVQVIYDAAGAPEAYVAINRDIGERRRLELEHARLSAAAVAAQRDRAAALALLDALVAGSPTGMGFLDANMRYVRINQALAALNGRTPDEHLGHTIAEMIPMMAPKLEPLIRQVLATGEPVREVAYQGQSLGAQGEPGEWLVNFYPVRGPEGQILGIGVAITDITPIRRVEEALQASEERFREAIDHFPSTFVIYDAERRIRYINDRGVGISGLPLEAIIGRRDEEIFPPSVTDHYLPLLLQALEGGAPQAGECTFVLPAGTFIAEVTYIPLKDKTGRLTQILGITYDVTERRQAEDRLRAAHTQLQASERAVVEHAEALSRTNAALTRALRLKDEFLAMMSHELRTPLNVILGITEAMDEALYGPVSARQRQGLATIMQSGRHLLALLSDILDLARIEAGAETLERTPVEIEILCQSTLQFVRATAEAKHIGLQSTVAPGIVGLQADERRLTQILVNLLDNAVKFTPVGGTVGLEVTADDEEHIEFTVWDNGIGIAKEDLTRLFRPFTQVDGRLSRHYGGIGLGLTLVQRLVELHGGGISLASTPGKGSRFTVRLPWSAADNAAPGAAQGPAPLPHSRPQPPGAAQGPAPLPHSRPQPRVVIADDHEPTLQLYADLLGAQGCQVVTARTGEDAIAQVKATLPAVVVLDIQMPGMDGLTAMRQIRDDPAAGTTPIIVLTALAMPGDRERCLAAGATRYLPKPVGVRTLVAALAEVLADPGSPQG